MNPNPSNIIFIIAGEPSGDQYGARLARSLKAIDPGISLSGIGGDAMRSAGVDLFYHTNDLSFSGFTEVFVNLRKILSIRKQVLKIIFDSKPSIIICIDFPDFNISLARKIHKRLTASKDYSPELIYYVTPQIWIWRKYRIKYLKKYFNAVIPIFEFEHRLFLKYGIQSHFFGHPISDFLQYPEKIIQKQDNTVTILLLPGSRRSEIKHILPVFIKSLKYYEHHFLPIHTKLKILAVKASYQLSDKTTDVYLLSLKKQFQIDEKESLYDAIAESDIILTKPGTVNLEAAFFGKPMIVVYKTSLINWIIIKIFVKTPFASLINILSNKMIVQEFTQFEAKSKKIAEEIENIYSNSEYRIKMIQSINDFAKDYLSLYKNVSERIADFILKQKKM